MREEAAMPYQPDEPGRPAESGIEGVRARNERRLMDIDGVKGVGIGRTPLGDDAILLYVRDESVRSRLPATVEGYPVEVIVTGEIDAYGQGTRP